MRAGQLREAVSFFESTETVGSAGDPQPSWSETAEWTVWARKRTLSASEETIASARQSTEDAVFEIRYLDGLTTEFRLLHGSTYYDITGIRDPDGRKAMMHVYASSGRRYGA